jgi:hypothetical protein
MTAAALARDMQLPRFPFLREVQWLRPSGGGWLLAMPPCYRTEGELAMIERLTP